MTEIPLPSNPSLWRRVTAGYAKLLEIMLAACVGILVIPVTLQVISDLGAGRLAALAHSRRMARGGLYLDRVRGRTDCR
jgi:hypothetical protein